MIYKEQSSYERDPLLDGAEYLIARAGLSLHYEGMGEGVYESIWNEARRLLKEGRYADLEALVRMSYDALVSLLMAVTDGPSFYAKEARVFSFLEERFDLIATLSRDAVEGEFANPIDAIPMAWARFSVQRRIQFKWSVTGVVPLPWEDTPERMWIKGLGDDQKLVLRAFILLVRKRTQEAFDASDDEAFQALRGGARAVGERLFEGYRYQEQPKMTFWKALLDSVNEMIISSNEIDSETYSVSWVRGVMSSLSPPNGTGKVFKGKEPLVNTLEKMVLAASTFSFYER